MTTTVDERDITFKYGLEHSHCLFGASPATAANWGPFFTATHPIEILRVFVSWTANSTSGTFQLEKLEAGEAIGAGDNILSATVSTASGAGTPVERKGSQLTSASILRAGDRIGLEDGGTLTNLTDLVVTLYYVPVNRGQFIP